VIGKSNRKAADLEPALAALAGCLRDALRGARRFDEFQKSLAIAPNMLTRRLNSLVESGLLERRPYSARPPRYEYVPTESARDFRPVLWMLISWGNKHFAPEGPSLLIVDAKTGARADPIVVDRATGRRPSRPKRSRGRTEHYKAAAMSVSRHTIVGKLADATTQVRRRLSLKQVGLAGAAIVLIAAAIASGARWWTVGRFIESTDDAYVGGTG
jgi:DNA-binding HxlR family transcriptional regulator